MRRLLFLSTLIILSFPLNGQSPDAFQKKIDKAFKRGQLAWQFSDPSEVVKIFGEPIAQKTERSGGMEMLTYEYGNNIFLRFGRSFERDKHAGLSSYTINGTTRYSDAIPKPRNPADLNRVDSFLGVSDMDLSRLDLKGSKDLLSKLRFNTNTKWPTKRRMPKDFDPDEILYLGKNPGLGIKKLHELGLNGKGVGIAIIDQPSLPNHIEYKDNIKMYVELKPDIGPQMHGPYVTSLAAGKTCGVAPGASIYYFSMPMWEPTNSYYIQAIERIIELNANGLANIRAISISNGMFEQYPEFDEFQQIVSKAESKGIAVFTCAYEPFNIPTASLFNTGILRPLSIHNREHPSDYVLGTYSDGTETFLVPGDCVAYASEVGDTVYTYSQTGGRSNVPPWLAGLVAIGFQVNPNLAPENVKKFLLDSASKMPYGVVVNPAGFIDLCKNF